MSGEGERRRRKSVASVLCLAGLVGGWLAAVPLGAHAHTGGSMGYASISIGRRSIRYSLTLWPSSLPPETAQALLEARAGREPGRERLLGLIHEKIRLTDQGTPCVAGPGFVQSSLAAESVILVVDFSCAAAVQDLLIRDDLFDVLGKDYHTLGKIEAPGLTEQFAFTPETRETRVRLGGGSGAGRGAGSFFLLGIEHILSGWDHVLFLVSLLLLRGGGWLSVAKIITAFTIAHSVTLALAVLQIVSLPDRLVEAVIALSIAFVAAENLFFQPAVGRRWLVSFSFGLVHGFGFSSALRELGLPAQGLLVSLLGFNLGVEVGQALVVAVVLPALFLLRRTRWERRMVWSSSLAILLVGLALFVERALL